MAAIRAEAGQDLVTEAIQPSIPTEVKLPPHGWLVVLQGDRQPVTLAAVAACHCEGIPLVLNLILNITQQALKIVVPVRGDQVIGPLANCLDKLIKVGRGKEALIAHEAAEFPQRNALITQLGGGQPGGRRLLVVDQVVVDQGKVVDDRLLVTIAEAEVVVGHVEVPVDHLVALSPVLQVLPVIIKQPLINRNGVHHIIQ